MPKEFGETSPLYESPVHPSFKYKESEMFQEKKEDNNNNNTIKFSSQKYNNDYDENYEHEYHDNNNNNDSEGDNDDNMNFNNSEVNEISNQKKKSFANLISFFVFGLFNNYAYVVMLSAAEDLMEGKAGAILLANILPTLIIKLTAPFYMHRIPYFIRVILVVLFAIGSFFMVAFVKTAALKLTGVCLASISAGGGEITFLALSSFYSKNTVSAWSSGTGGAGIFGSLSYLALRSWFNLSSRDSLLIVTGLPVFIALCYFFVLRKPDQEISASNDDDDVQQRLSEGVETEEEEEEEEIVDPDVEDDALSQDDHAQFEHPEEHQHQSGAGILQRRRDREPQTAVTDLTIKEKVKYLVPLLRYMIPLFVVYYTEYSINQGVAPTILFENVSWIPSKKQYLYYSFLYQAGVFVSRSSVNFFPIRRIWMPAVLQTFNLIFLIFQAYFMFIPWIWIIFPMIFWEGLLGGATYVNAFYLISVEIEKRYREFSLGVTSVADSGGIAVSGVTSLFLESWLSNHNATKAN